MPTTTAFPGSSIRRAPGGRGPFWPGVIVLGVLALGSCDTTPTAPVPAEEIDVPDRESPPPRGGTPGEIFSDRAHVLQARHFELTSSEEDLEAGLYRYRITDESAVPEIARDDFIVVDAEEPYVRLVLSSKQVGDDLVIDTGPGLWSDVIQSGSYGVTLPFSPADGPAQTFSGITLDPITVGPLEGVPFPPLRTDLEEVDVCGLIHDVLGALVDDPQVCGSSRTLSVGVGVVALSVEGTMDSLVIESGNVAFSGNMDLGMEVDAGGITGGSVPVFAPCNRRSYLGCLSTPTGANLIDFLRKHAPSIPEASLPPVRVCVPGTPVRVRRGYWDTSGFVPVWRGPTFETCRISNPGELPEIVPPSVREVESVIRPRVQGEMTFRVRGDGALGFKMPIPTPAGFLGTSVGYGGKHLAAKASAGLFIAMKLELKNAGGTFYVRFDEDGVIEQEWTQTSGWDGDYRSEERDVNAQLLRYETPDSIVFRAGIQAEVSGELCAALIDCKVPSDEEDEGETEGDGTPPTAALTQLAVKVKAGVSGFYGGETTFSRHQVNPADPEITNYQFGQEYLMDLKLEAGLHVPLGWLIPGVLPNYSETFEFGRIPLQDTWGTGALRIVVNSEGDYPDPDGYRVLVSRYDTEPPIIRPGTERVGQATEHGRNLWMDLGVADSVLFQDLRPCSAFYSDAALVLSPAGHAVVSGLRATGVDIPTWAITTHCDLLIARYNVELTEVAENCEVVGGALRDDVWLHQINPSLGRLNNLKRVEFEVDCSADPDALGSLSVTTATSGRPPDGPYRLTLDGSTGGVIEPNETRVFDWLAPGPREIGLADVPAGCVTASVQVEIEPETTVDLFLGVECPEPDQEPGTVTVSSTQVGAGGRFDSYDLRVDGVSRASLPAAGVAWIDGLPAGVPTVLQVTNMEGSCRPLTPNPVVVTLDAEANPQAVDFQSACTDAPIDTLQGVVESTGWPTPVVSVRTADGQTIELEGYGLDEIHQLAGSPVRVWGERGPLRLDVFGYDLRTALHDPRWMGIVTARPDGLWLFGEEAIPLIDPPDTLLDREGALVWVSGPRSPAGVTPLIYAVLREAQP